MKKQVKRKKTIYTILESSQGLPRMTGKVQKVLSWVVMAVLVVQVVFPGGLFNFDVPKAEATVTFTVTITTPSAVTDWDIGDGNSIVWLTDNGGGDNPAYFKLYYSEDSGSSWNLIDGNVPYTGSPQLYGWETPVVNGAGESDFEIKVEAYDVGNNLLASDASDDFKIDYGPIDHYVLDADAETAYELVFNMPVTAKDQYNNTILNYSIPTIDIQYCISGSGDWIASSTYATVWSSGVTNSLNGVIHLTLPTPGISYDLRAGSINNTDTISVVAEGVYIDAPTSATSWIIGTSGNSITFRAGGETAIDHLDLAYSPDNGANYYTIENGVADGVMPQTYSWTVNNDVPGAQWKVRVKSYTAADALIATGTSAGFTVAYGDVASFTVVAPPTGTPNKFFSLTVTAKDTYGNTITTFNNAVALGATPTDISPVTIGNGSTTGSWSNGVVTFDSYLLTAPGLHTITATYSGATGQTSIVMSGGGSSHITGCTKDVTAPASKVVGILDANNNILPMPATTYKGPITVVVEAQDLYMDITADGCPLGVGVDTAELKVRKGNGDWESKGNGIYFISSGGKQAGYDYYKWTIDVPAKTYATWYFYSIAVDYDSNTEEPPGTPGYDALTVVNTIGPYLSASNPLDQQKDVAINMPIILTFSQPMDRVSTQAALTITRVDGVAVPDLRLTYSWRNSNKTLTIGHKTAFLYNINYKVTIDPAIATNKNGIYLITSDPNANPNPFIFTTALPIDPLKPYLATSTKAVNMLVAAPGATPLYTIVLRNTGRVTANVIFRDPIPANTVYDTSVAPVTNAIYDAVKNEIVWNGTLARNATYTITFRVKINSQLVNGLEIRNTAYINDGVNPEIEKYAITVVSTLPTSKVIGIIDKDGNFVSVVAPATPINVYFSPLTIVAEVQNATSVANTDLWYRPVVTGGVWTNYGPGVKLKDNPDGSAQYKWDLNIANQNRTYYFYTRASDGIGNIEAVPPSPGYDMRIKAYTIQPYIKAITPAADKTNVGRTAYIQVSFSQTMDIVAVQNAITITKADGTPLPDGFFAYTWYSTNRTIRLTHTTPFDYKTTYQVKVDPAIALSVNGVPFNPSDPLARPNEWKFTTAVAQIPDLTTSVKGVNKDQTDPGDILLYTLVVDNKLGVVAARVTVTDPLPTNTTYANYVSGGLRYNTKTKILTWSGTVPAGMSQIMSFQVKINQPLDNGVLITNTATLKDQTNPAVERIATTMIGSAPDWSTSTRTVTIAPPRADGKALPGDVLTYVINVINTGNMNASNVTITDNIPLHSTLIPESVALSEFVYNGATNILQWVGSINTGQMKELSYQVKLDTNTNVFLPPNNKVSNQTTIADGISNYVMPSTVMVNVPDDPNDPDDPVGPHKQPPYIMEQIQPAMNAKSVKLYGSIFIPFSKVMDPESIQYLVKFGNHSVNTDKWQSIWDDDGTDLTLIPNQPLEAGETYTIQVIEGVDGDGLGLITDGPIPNNEWSFTTVRPALYFSSPSGPVSFLAGTVAGPITVKIGDWTNFSNKDVELRQYAPYTVEKTDLILNLESTSATGRFGLSPSGEFYTKSWGPWYNNPADANQYLRILAGQSEAQFYYTDTVLGYNSITAADLSQGYTVVDTPGKTVVVTSESNLVDQIYFASSPQSIPANKYSDPIVFGIMNGRDDVWLTAGRAFLLSSTSPTGQFFTSDQRPLDQYVVFNTNIGPQIYYQHYIQSDRITETIFYRDSIPGDYTLMIADGRELGIVAVGLRPGLRPGGTSVPEGGPPAAESGSGPEGVQIAAEYSEQIAKSAGQNIIVLPLGTQEYEELLEELQEIKDNTGRILARVEINPKDITLLPGGAKAFTARGYDTEGKEIKELVFSWYVIAGGGTIMKHGLASNNHNSRFTAGRVPGVYYDTVLVMTYYNGEVMVDTATVRVARTIDYGTPGQLPSTGPNGIQWVFMILTLLSAVALAAVEHYEKNYLVKRQTIAK